MLENLFPREHSLTLESQVGVGIIEKTAKPSIFFKSTVSVQYKTWEPVALLM